MAWIESHQELGRHPKLIRLARRLQISRPAAVGHLQYLWWWAMDYAQDGVLTGMDAGEVAEAAEWDGDPQEFFESLAEVGFIDLDGDDCTIHDWHDYAGKLIQKRQANAARMKQSRAANVQGTCIARAGATVPNRTQPNLTESNDSVSPAVKPTPWEPPEFFKPLTELEGYKNKSHQKSANTIKATCEAQEVSPAEVVAQFAEYYQGNRFRHGWTDPVASLNKTLPVQISKVKKGEGPARASPNGVYEFEEHPDGYKILPRSY